MKTYEVYLHTKVVQICEVEANNADQAIEKAKELGIEQGGWDWRGFFVWNSTEDQEYDVVEIRED